MQREDDLFEALRKGDRAALGKAITLIESTRQADIVRARTLVEQCLPISGKALRLGVTGIPGVGKSTLIDALGTWMIERGHRVAVLAIDPSSARSGGSILGDKTRMDRLSQNEAAFVRPTPTSGALGGVARRSREALVLCEAAGYDRVLIETVGTGQNELDVDRMTDLNLLLMIAGAGDDLQGIKRGIMESADLIAFTKAEGEAAKRAEAARSDLKAAVMLLPPRSSGRQPDILLTSASTGSGIADLGKRIEELHATDLASGLLTGRRRDQQLQWMDEAIEHGLLDMFRADRHVESAAGELRKAVRDGIKSPFCAAEELLALFKKGDAPLP